MLFGASYYHEYQPHDRLDEDLDLMIDAGFTMIRVGESTWSSYEPREGEISFDALRQVVLRAAGRGLKVIVGTPTYAIPPWMAARYPEVMVHDSAGHPVPYGARQNVDFTNAIFRRFASRLIERMIPEFASIDGVIGFQVDNEIGVFPITNPDVVDRFRSEVVQRAGGVDELNRVWGLTYWSQRIQDPTELWVPNGNTNPGYALEWHRFQRRLTNEFLEWQRDIIRPLIQEDQFIFHDQVSGWSHDQTGQVEIANSLDHTAVNIYLPYQDALALPAKADRDTLLLAPEWTKDSGVWTAVWRADMARGLRGPRGESFSLTEAQATSIGGPEVNVPPYPGQLRLFADLMLARGADLLAYWHWHSLHYGFETYWGGVLGHDLRPNRIYAEVAELGHHLQRLPKQLEGLIPDSDVAFLYSPDSNAALRAMPMMTVAGSQEPDRRGYQRVFERMFRGALDAGLQSRIVHENSDWSGEAVLVVPALYIADDDLLDRIVEHARAGAHVIFTFRSGYADEWARVRWVTQPARIADSLGAAYQEFTSLPHAVPLVSGPSWSGILSADASATAWADLLVVDDGDDVLLAYDDPFLKDYAAATTHQVGKGRITWIGSLLDSASTAQLVSWALSERGQVATISAWEADESVRISSARLAEGGRCWFVAHHNWGEVSVPVPPGLELIDADTGEHVADSVVLGSWASRILIEQERL